MITLPPSGKGMKTFYRSWLRKSNTEDDLERTKVRLILAFAFLGIIVSLCYWVVHPIVVFNVPRWLYVFLPLLLTASALLLLVRVHHFWVGQAIVFSYWVTFVIGSYFSGGIQSIVLPWVSLLPVMANLILTYRHSLVWFIVSFLTILFFSLFRDMVPPIRYTDGPWRALFSLTGLSLILFLFTSLFDRTRYRLLQILRVRNMELHKQQHNIEAQNEEIIQQNEEIKTQLDFIGEKQRETEARNAVLEQHWNTLLALSKSKSINFGSLRDALREIVKITARSLQVSRVSIWSFDGAAERIQCLVCYSLVENQFMEHAEIRKAENPAYFDLLKKERVINASNARTAHATTGFAANYLEPLGIYSLMDAPFFLDSELRGVICCEQQGEPREWTAEDIIFATSMADIISLAYRAAQRREYELHIRQQSRDITRMNETLEERVRERTHVLAEQNKQLAEYAFINSHKLRAPVSRILGLISLIDHDLIEKDDEVLGHLRTSCRELDDIVLRIAETLDKGGHFSREDFGK
jgi:hypothetical protein